MRGARCHDCPNPKLDKLREMITKAYRENFENSRGIVFVKTRDLSKAIQSWMKETPELRDLNPIVFLGTNSASVKGGLSIIILSFFWLCFMSHQNCKCYTTIFQLYWWRKSSGARASVHYFSHDGAPE